MTTIIIKGRRPENAAMETFLHSHGINAIAKYLWKGSMKGTWRLYNHDLQWTLELQEKLTGLGFSSWDGAPLHRFSGNGGLFSVFVRGHNELLGTQAAPNS